MATYVHETCIIPQGYKFFSNSYEFWRIRPRNGVSNNTRIGYCKDQDCAQVHRLFVVNRSNVSKQPQHLYALKMYVVSMIWKQNSQS
jgi:hypothetical protein